MQLVSLVRDLAGILGKCVIHTCLQYALGKAQCRTMDYVAKVSACSSVVYCSKKTTNSSRSRVGYSDLPRDFKIQ